MNIKVATNLVPIDALFVSFVAALSLSLPPMRCREVEQNTE